VIDSPNEALLQQGDYQTLWERALPLVKWQLGRMVKSGAFQPHDLTDDMIQECSLAVGKALPRWSPARGTLANFVIHRIRGCAMDHIRREASGIVGGRRAQGRAGPLDEATLPSGQLPALDLLLARESNATIQSALTALNLDEYDVLVRYYGLDHYPPRTVRSIAKAYNQTTEEVYRLLMRATASMRTMLSDTDSEDSHEQTRHASL